MERSGEAGREPIPVTVGTMGWSYADWNGGFYPDGSESADWLALYARVFDTVEIDSTFYGTPRAATIQHWARSVPPQFVFCSKVPRIVTHDLRLVDAMGPLAEFVHAMAAMGAKRGPMLFQMPPSFTLGDVESLRALLAALHDLDDPGAQFAIEFRHPSLLTTDVFAMLREHNVAFAAADYPGMPRRFALTADFAYVRLVGRHGAFESHRAVAEDRSNLVRRWAAALSRRRAKFSRAWVLCNNDFEGFAPATAWSMQDALGLPTRRPAAELQGKLL
jgi:uncharacterized protein YecE (DUF72 family)